jgi:phytoene dehydrogenase-like protein
LGLLLKKLQELGGEIRFKTPVNEILVNEKAEAIGVNAGGEEIFSSVIFSSMGYPETVRLTKAMTDKPRVGRMTFLESIFVFDKKLHDPQATIVFYNDSSRYAYRPATNFFDSGSAVVCFPDNYEYQKQEGEGTVRVTYMANYHQWRELERSAYEQTKEAVAQSALALLKKLAPHFDGKLLFRDVFSPLTIERYTWHLNGTVYGSVDKTRDGRTSVKNLFIIGTDQGFLGIVGAMLSGISMANLHGLMNGGET